MSVIIIVTVCLSYVGKKVYTRERSVGCSISKVMSTAIKYNYTQENFVLKQSYRG